MTKLAVKDATVPSRDGSSPKLRSPPSCLLWRILLSLIGSLPSLGQERVPPATGFHVRVTWQSANMNITSIGYHGWTGTHISMRKSEKQARNMELSSVPSRTRTKHFPVATSKPNFLLHFQATLCILHTTSPSG